MTEDQFTKLFKYISSIDHKLDDVIETMATKDDIRQLQTVIDGYAAKIDDYAKEMAAMQHKIDRLERMIHYLANQANIPIEKLEAI